VCTHVKISHLVARSAHKPSTSCVRTAYSKFLTSLKQLVLKQLVTNLFILSDLLQGCSNKPRYGHDTTVLLQPCVVNLVTYLLYHDCIRDLLEQPCNLIMPPSLLQVVNSLFQTRYNNWEQAVRRQLVDSL
jgi:hypothetical protein